MTSGSPGGSPGGLPGDPFGHPFKGLPREIPIFPLPGALLLPHGRLPLNLFEERYLAMALDALKEERIIGMVQPLEFQHDPVAGDAPIFGIGCAGRITSFSETDDGRILISLKGICRFNIAGEVEGRNGYRRVAADYGPFRNDLAEQPGFDFDREELFGLLRRFFESRGLQADWDSLENADDETLIVSLAMMCPFDVSEKQALLEAPEMPDVPDVLMSLLAMAGIEGEAPASRH